MYVYTLRPGSYYSMKCPSFMFTPTKNLLHFLLFFDEQPKLAKLLCLTYGVGISFRRVLRCGLGHTWRQNFQ